MTERRRRSSARRLAVPVLGAAVSLAAIWFATRGIDLSATLTILTRVDAGPLVIVAVALAAQLLIRSLRWSVLLPDGQSGRVPAGRLVPIVLIGYLGNAVLPARMGDPVRAVLVGRREAIAASSAFGSVVLERAVDTLTLALIVFPAAAISGAPDWFVRAAGVAVVIAGAVVGIAQTDVPVRGLAATRRRSAARLVPWVDRAERFAVGMNTHGRSQALVAAAALSLVAWLLDGTIYWACGRAVGIDLPFAGAMLVSGITVLGTAIPSAPGYVGTFELAASTVAQGLGVAPAPALAFAILVHALTVLPLAIGGAAALIWIGARFEDLTADRIKVAPEPLPTGPYETTIR